MFKFAVVKIGGSQYKVSESDEVEVDKIEGEKGGALIFDKVLLLADDKKVKIGTPELLKRT